MLSVVSRVLGLTLLVSATVSAQPPGTNYDESKVPQYELPDPLTGADGTPVRTAKDWPQRRAEILELFQTHVYGRSPDRPETTRFLTTSTDTKALDGLATRKQITIRIGQEPKTHDLHLLLYVPNAAKQRVPTFLGLNFRGNHSIHADPGIDISTAWMRSGAGVVDNRATEAGRGVAASRWPVEMILKRGYGLATMYYGNIDPDQHDGFRNGVHALYEKESTEERAGDAWGSIAAWAWGLSRALDYLEIDPAVDGKRVAVLGHSRLGKTALWAGASDPRFALVISNDSGCGGAALSRRQFGETIARINSSFPHWFCRNFRKYDGNEDELPVDQHMLVALIAPRPVYIASAVDDKWADPKGEFLSALHADPVYRLLGTSGLPAKEHPPVDSPVVGTIGYHIRTGKHDVTDYDWQQYLAFADKHLR